MNIRERYLSGEAIPAREFRDSEGGLEVFGNLVWEDFKKGQEVGQYDLEGELWHRKTNPIEFKSEEEIHLARE